MEPIEEHTLAVAASRGDQQAFARLYSLHFNRLWHSALKHVGDEEAAEELVQETFARAFKAIDQFRGEAKFSTWLTSILVRQCIERWRKQKREIAVGSGGSDGDGESEKASILETAAAVETPPDSGLLAKERIVAVRKALAALGENERRAVQLFYFERRLYREIAEMTGWPMGTVMTYLHRGRMQLADVLKDEWGPG
ncbi:MAG TPA: sigma-70 family RNA polymerase sigma factor [Planctomycetota bacterium]|nr:sigma-70 family RNA polymerase sigma factor [Planctomycetota bacterium]